MSAIDDLIERRGGRVGLTGVLGDLDRVALPAYSPGRRIGRAFALDREDSWDRAWWPQGITTSADATDSDAPVETVLTSAYTTLGGSRISVFDVRDPDRWTYRHVSLVRATPEGHRPVKVHAGGLVWRGRHLYVAATAGGLVSFDLHDVCADGLGGYLLPLRRTFATDDIRCSFCSLTRTPNGPALLVGEYAHGPRPRRIVSYLLDEHGLMRPDTGEQVGAGPPGMQGAVLIDGILCATSSNGPGRHGDLWVGPPGQLRRLRGAAPVGVEDLAHDPAGGLLWSATEHRGVRWVFTLPLSGIGVGVSPLH